MPNARSKPASPSSTASRCSSPAIDAWAKRFEDAGVPVIGDDIKSQLGATIVHRMLTDLFNKRGVKLDRTYQLNTGGNTDFLNMLERARLASKKISKTEAVQAVAEHRLDDENIHVGPSDYVPGRTTTRSASCGWKASFRRRPDEHRTAAVRRGFAQQRRRRDRPGPLRACGDGSRAGRPYPPRSIGLCKHPPRQVPDDEAFVQLEDFLGNRPSA